MPIVYLLAMKALGTFNKYNEPTMGNNYRKNSIVEHCLFSLDRQHNAVIHALFKLDMPRINPYLMLSSALKIQE